MGFKGVVANNAVRSCVVAGLINWCTLSEDLIVLKVRIFSVSNVEELRFIDEFAYHSTSLVLHHQSLFERFLKQIILLHYLNERGKLNALGQGHARRCKGLKIRVTH